MKRLAIALALTALTIPAHAAEKIKVQDAITLSTALRNLDGHMVTVKQNGADATIMIPWEFGSGSFRLRIANNIAILDSALKLVEDTRQKIIKEITQKAGTTEIKPGSPEMDDYQKQYNEIAAQPAAGTQDLSRIKSSELRLDKNEIPVTVIAALKPILDDDVTK